MAGVAQGLLYPAARPRLRPHARAGRCCSGGRREVGGARCALGSGGEEDPGGGRAECDASLATRAITPSRHRPPGTQLVAGAAAQKRKVMRPSCAPTTAERVAAGGGQRARGRCIQSGGAHRRGSSTSLRPMCENVSGPGRGRRTSRTRWALGRSAGASSGRCRSADRGRTAEVRAGMRRRFSRAGARSPQLRARRSASRAAPRADTQPAGFAAAGSCRHSDDHALTAVEEDAPSVHALRGPSTPPTCVKMFRTCSSEENTQPSRCHIGSRPKEGPIEGG